MNTYGIDKRVWSKVVGKKPVTPGLVALAASLCPELLDEKTSVSRVDKNGKVSRRPFKSLAEAEQSDVAAECHGRNASVVIRDALAKWAASSVYIGDSLVDLFFWDPKLTVWCVSAVAATTLKYLPAGENRPRVAIETARRWAMGRATQREVNDAVTSAYAATYAARSRVPDEDGYDNQAFNTADYYAAYSAMEAIDVANEKNIDEETMAAIEGAVGGAAKAAVYAANAAYVAAADVVALRRSPNWAPLQKTEYLRLREVVADAIINYPTGDMVNASRGLSRNTLAAGALGAVIGAGVMHFARRP